MLQMLFSGKPRPIQRLPGFMRKGDRFIKLSGMNIFYISHGIKSRFGFSNQTIDDRSVQSKINKRGVKDGNGSNDITVQSET